MNALGTTMARLAAFVACQFVQTLRAIDRLREHLLIEIWVAQEAVGATRTETGHVINAGDFFLMQ